MAVSSSSLRFLPPGNGGTEGGVKTIEEDSEDLTGKSCANEQRNESSLSNCRVQPALSIKEGLDRFSNKHHVLNIIMATI